MVRRRNRVIRRIAYIGYLIVAVFLLLEVALRIYNPFHLRLKGDKIVLPVDQQLIISNSINPKLDPLVVNTRNSFGFRGPELPRDRAGLLDTAGLLKIITIGGSTTECHFLNDDKTWPWLLGERVAEVDPRSWLNNAGLDGHSTYGHIILLNDDVKRLKPSVIIFLVGVNEVENAAPTFHDKLNTRGAMTDWRHYLFENSEVLNLVVNLCRGWRAQRFNNTTNTLLVLDSMQRKPLADSVVGRRMDRQRPYIEGFRGRLQDLADTCIAWHILPVFLTQPNQFGYGRDSATGADLALFPPYGMKVDMNGKLMWEMLELYNDVTREVCRGRNLPLIDLARMMPKNSIYFYDMSHFTNQGAAEVCDLVAGPLEEIIKEHHLW